MISSPVVFMPITVQTVAYTGTAAASAAFGTQIRTVRLVSTTDCFVYFAADPTATTANGTFLPANTVEYFRVTPADKVSAIRLASSGNLYVSEMDL